MPCQPHCLRLATLHTAVATGAATSNSHRELSSPFRCAIVHKAVATGVVPCGLAGGECSRRGARGRSNLRGLGAIERGSLGSVVGRQGGLLLGTLGHCVARAAKASTMARRRRPTCSNQYCEQPHPLVLRARVTGMFNRAVACGAAATTGAGASDSVARLACRVH